MNPQTDAELTPVSEPSNDRLHTLLIERANADATKRIQAKQKTFGHSHDIESELIARAEVARLNRQELIRLMATHELTIPARSFPNWRPTQRTLGDIPGVADGVTIIATDGILGYFLHTNGVLIGHIQKFTSDIKPLFSVQKPKDDTGKAPKVKRINKKSARQKLIDSL